MKRRRRTLAQPKRSRRKPLLPSCWSRCPVFGCCIHLSILADIFLWPVEVHLIIAIRRHTMGIKRIRSEATASWALYIILTVLLLLFSPSEHLSGVSSFTPTNDNVNNNHYHHNTLFVRNDQQELHQQSSFYRRQYRSSSSSSEFRLNMAVSSSIIRPIPATQTDETHKAANEVLEGLGIPFGLRQVLLSSLGTYEKRIWIVDNSGRYGKRS